MKKILIIALAAVLILIMIYVFSISFLNTNIIKENNHANRRSAADICFDNYVECLDGCEVNYDYYTIESSCVELCKSSNCNGMTDLNDLSSDRQTRLLCIENCKAASGDLKVVCIGSCRY